MRKIVLFSILTLSFFACQNKETKTGNVHLRGNIAGLSQGKLYLQKLQDTAFVTIDSVLFKGNSNFDCYFNIESPEVIYLSLDRGQTQSIDNNLPIFVEPGEITLNTKLKEFFSAAEIKGSKNQDLWEAFKKSNSNFTNANLDIIQKRLENELNYNAAKQDSIDNAYKKLLRKKYLFVTNFAITNANYEIAPYLALTEIPDINVAFLDSIANKMPPKVASSKYGKMLNEHIKDIKKNQ
ncbi:DUF4369 domain-containing protein [Flavobacterium sp.]|uniref:DUF4369 domain-containing protein n=1 Tax=Flavobacterium sp. TaxID=239 RepID=UPI00352969ED